MIPINFVVVLNIALLSEKDDFYSNLNMKSITDLDYNHVKRASNDLGEYITKVIHYGCQMCLKKNIFINLSSRSCKNFLQLQG